MKQKNQFGDFDILARLSEKGWAFEGEYQNAHAKGTFICPSGHRMLASWCAVKHGFFCKACQDKMVGEKVSKYLAGTEWHIVGVRNGVITIQCNDGHDYVARYVANIRKKIERHPRCSGCDEKSYADNIRSVFEESGWSMLEDYKRYHRPILCECPNGHRQMKAPSGFLGGKGCQKCAGLCRRTRQEVEKEFSDLGWRLVGEYVNTSTPVECMCPMGHAVKKSIDCIRISPVGCVVCSGQTPVHPLKKRERRNERVKNWRKWSPLILERDGHKCVICGSSDGVNAHHLNSYHRSVDERYDVENGATLCFRHHGSPFNRFRGSFHVVFGFMNNTKEQFEEYRKMCLSGDVRIYDGILQQR